MAKKLIYIFLIITAVICLNSNISAKDDNNIIEVFKAGNNLYEKSDFTGAIEKYQMVIGSGVKNKTVYYNLGNAYYKTNKLGLAVLNYKRAYKLSPRDKDILANLAFLREKIVDQIKYEKPVPQIMWDKVIFLLSLNEWTLLCLILYLLFMSLLIYSILKRDVDSEAIFYRNLIFIIFSISLIFFISSYLNNKQLEAVITAEEVEVKNGPGENYSKGFILHEGMEVNIENDSGDWVEIILPNGLKGWVEKNNIQFTKD
ncbi:MAG: tetratricopeptide repeat protein [bacterium]|nr:tetratricopeptide repeat protein [bacterium]